MQRQANMTVLASWGTAPWDAKHEVRMELITGSQRALQGVWYLPSSWGPGGAPLYWLLKTPGPAVVGMKFISIPISWRTGHSVKASELSMTPKG